jgi:hypothetical protein
MLTPSGRPYAPGTKTAKVYVLKETDEWLADESEVGAIWSGGLGKVKSNQHTGRFILDHEGFVLRPPLVGAGIFPPAGISGDAVKAARAIGQLQIDDSLRQYLLRSLIRQITPDKPAFTTRAARVAGAKTHGDHVVMCWVTAVHISRKGADVEGFLRVGTVTCRVTPEQHDEVSYLPSKPHMADLPDAMRAAGSPEQLLELGWERYRRATIKWYKAASTAGDL